MSDSNKKDWVLCVEDFSLEGCPLSPGLSHLSVSERTKWFISGHPQQVQSLHSQAFEAFYKPSERLHIQKLRKVWQSMLCRQQVYPDHLRRASRSPSHAFLFYSKGVSELFCVIPSLVTCINSSSHPFPSEEQSWDLRIVFLGPSRKYHW